VLQVRPHCQWALGAVAGERQRALGGEFRSLDRLLRRRCVGVHRVGSRDSGPRLRKRAVERDGALVVLQPFHQRDAVAHAEALRDLLAL
jgi:hypothetical protein